jgi:PAS domain-containing protein
MSENRHLKRSRGNHLIRDSSPGTIHIFSCLYHIPLTSGTDTTDTEVGDSEQSCLRSLDRIGILELLELDSRPTLIIDLLAPENEIDGRLKITWGNKSLKFFDVLRRVIHTDTYYPAITPRATVSAALAAAEAEFKEWAVSMPDFDSELDGFMPRHEFKSMYWSGCTLRGRWRVISASQVPNQRRRSHGTPRTSRSRSSSVDRSSADTLTAEESELSRQLADSESKFRVLTELNPIGMYYLSPDGNILYCNDMWYEITGHPRGLEGEMCV